MSDRLKDKVAIVTGAADGIGQAIARLFAAEGAKVCIADINKEQGEAFAEALRRDGLKVFFQRTDVSDAHQVAQMLDTTISTFGPPEILINNAGIIPMTPEPIDVAQETYDRVFQVNLTGMWNCSRAVMGPMKKARRGAIVNIASVHAFKIVRGHFPYAVTKHAVIGLTRNLAVEYGQYGIRVNALCPGMVETPNAFKAWDQTLNPETARQAIANLHPLGRNGTTEEIAHPALFLASDGASFISGQTLIADGGRSVVYHD